MSISSLDQFKRVVIENGYEYDNVKSDIVYYGYEITRDTINGNQSTKWAWYNKHTNRWMFSFSRKNIISSLFGAEADNTENPYDLIFEEVKEKCSFSGICDSFGDEYACYDCPELSFKGVIGFRNKEGWGYIRTFFKIKL